MAGNSQEHRCYKAKIKWPVVVQPSNGAMEGVTLDLSSTSAFIRCAKPLRLNEVFEMLVNVPALSDPLEITAEVVWSNIYGPDDEITPRGMGARFIKISGRDRKIISQAVMSHLKLEGMKPEDDTIEISPALAKI